MRRTFVVGDIHGAYRALRQCLERSAFNFREDHLICLGDVCDGWPETKPCIDLLLEVKNLTYILGNHDTWALDWMKTGTIHDVWYAQGGEATILSYTDEVPVRHRLFLEKAVPYYLVDNKLFVHAGIDPLRPLEEQDNSTFLWDRNLARTVMEFHLKKIEGKLTTYREVYLGHTPVPYAQPLHWGDVYLMDTGAGWSGVLSMMDIDTKEVFASDAVPSLYPGIKGRVKR
ncbi:MAG TPA: metallophosphoesterase [Ohtaekwangia sp.]